MVLPFNLQVFPRRNPRLDAPHHCRQRHAERYVKVRTGTNIQPLSDRIAYFTIGAAGPAVAVKSYGNHHADDARRARCSEAAA